MQLTHQERQALAAYLRHKENWAEFKLVAKATGLTEDATVELGVNLGVYVIACDEDHAAVEASIALARAKS